MIVIIIIDFKEDTWGSARSPDLFEPAMMPGKSMIMMMMIMLLMLMMMMLKMTIMMRRS